MRIFWKKSCRKRCSVT